MIFIEPSSGVRILCQLGFEFLLSLDLTSQHSIGQWAIFGRNFVDQNQI